MGGAERAGGASYLLFAPLCAFGREVDNLFLSKCSQTTKDVLYPQAKRALSDRHNEFPYYYDKIRPFLGEQKHHRGEMQPQNEVAWDVDPNQIATVMVLWHCIMLLPWELLFIYFLSSGKLQLHSNSTYECWEMELPFAIWSTVWHGLCLCRDKFSPLSLHSLK